MKVYFASPLGFAASTQAFMDELERALIAAGLEVLNPWKGEFGPQFAEAEALTDRAAHAAALHRVNLAVGAANAAMIRECDAVVAVLDGVDVDSGTASEIGYAYGLGKRVYGLRTDTRLAGDNAGALVNLQVQYFIEASGGAVTTRLADLLASFALMNAENPEH